MDFISCSKYLPKGILNIILHYLDFEDLRSLKNTCAKFYHLIKYFITDVPIQYHDHQTALFFPNVTNLVVKLKKNNNINIMSYILKIGFLGIGLYIKDYFLLCPTLYIPENKSIKITNFKYINNYKTNFKDIVELKLNNRLSRFKIEPYLNKMLNLQKLQGNSIDISYYNNIKFYKTKSSIILHKKINILYIECDVLTINSGGQIKEIICNFLIAVDTVINKLQTADLSIKNCIIEHLIIPPSLNIDSIKKNNIIKNYAISNN